MDPAPSDEMRFCHITLSGLTLGFAAASSAFASDPIVTAVFSQTFNNYARARLPDGAIKPETFALGEGGRNDGRLKDDSIDKYSFGQLTRVLVPFLAARNYVPAQTPQKPDIMIVVHWGTTISYNRASYQSVVDLLQSANAPTAENSNPDALDDHFHRDYSMLMVLANSERDQDNLRNAQLLGYSPELANAGWDLKPTWFFKSFKLEDLISDLEEERYYVILAAYDFQVAWKDKQLRPLWITRVSLRAQGNRFDRVVENMVRAASDYFGADSKTLIRNRVREGTVEVGQPRVIEPDEAGRR